MSVKKVTNMIIERLDKNYINIIKDYLPANVTDSIYDADAVVYVTMEGDMVIAAMLIRESKSVAQIGYISVSDEYRNQGICTYMLSEYMRRCINSRIVRISCIIGDKAEEEYVHRVLDKLGFKAEPSFHSILTTSVREFINSKIPKVPLRGHVLMDFNELGNVGIRQVARVIRSNTSFRFTEKDLLSCNYELSFAIAINGEIKDFVIIMDSEDSLEIICMYSSKDDIAGSVILLNALQNKVKNIPDYFDKKVDIPIVNEASYKLVKHILPECESEKCNKMIYDFAEMEK